MPVSASTCLSVRVPLSRLRREVMGGLSLVAAEFSSPLFDGTESGRHVSHGAYEPPDLGESQLSG